MRFSKQYDKSVQKTPPGEAVPDCTALQQPLTFTLISIHGTKQQLQPPDTCLWAFLKVTFIYYYLVQIQDAKR